MRTPRLAGLEVDPALLAAIGQVQAGTQSYDIHFNEFFVSSLACSPAA